MTCGDAEGAHSDDTRHVSEWLEDLSATRQAIEGIEAMGVRAIEPLACYLARGPQPVSQSRVLAVHLLARFHAPCVVDVLRRVLHEHPLHGLPAALMEPELRVKDAAISALLAQRAATPEDVAWAVQSERLPAGIRAAGTLRLVGLVPSLIRLLSDDVLAGAAEDALHALSPDSVQPMLAAIRDGLGAQADTARTRLALMRAFCWLSASGVHVDGNLAKQALSHPCTLVRSAAALAGRDASNQDVLDALLHGALGSESFLAQACRDRLATLGGPVRERALNALRNDQARDVYGNAHPADRPARGWIVAQLLQQARHDISGLRGLLAQIIPDDLVGGLNRWQAPSMEALGLLMRHPDARVRSAALAAARRLSPAQSIPWLVDRMRDPDRHVGKQAYEALLHAQDTHHARVTASAFPWRLWLAHPIRCAHLAIRPRRG
jgi:hypothetical protein